MGIRGAPSVDRARSLKTAGWETGDLRACHIGGRNHVVFAAGRLILIFTAVHCCVEVGVREILLCKKKWQDYTLILRDPPKNSTTIRNTPVTRLFVSGPHGR